MGNLIARRSEPEGFSCGERPLCRAPRFVAMRFESIVIGVDFSEKAMQSAAWVARYLAPEAKITLVHVVDVPARPSFAPRRMPAREEIEAAAEDFARSQLTIAAAAFAGRTVDWEISVGKTHEAIARAASQHRADLIVIGPHGDRPKAHPLLGTTADRIVRTSALPVLVAIETPAGPPQRILVPVEDAPITPTVLDIARSLAQRLDADITLLNVWSNAEYSYVASIAHATATSDAEAERALDRDIDTAAHEWLEQVAKSGLRREQITSVVTHGAAGEAILRLAREIHANMIVMGGRGSGLVASTLLGSTVRTVLHSAECPVLVVRQPGE